MNQLFYGHNQAKSSPWQIVETTGITASESISTVYRGSIMKSDGSSFFCCSDNSVHEYALTTNWDITGLPSTPTLTKTTPDVVLSIGMYITVDGLNLYLSDDVPNNSVLHQYSMSTAWDLNTISLVQTKSFTGQMTQLNDIFISSSGTKMFLNSDTTMYSYTLSVPFDISSATYDSLALTSLTTWGTTWKPDGTELYYTNNLVSPIEIRQASYSTPFDLSTPQGTTDYYQAVVNNVCKGISFKPDGTRYYVIGNGTLYQFDID